MSGKRRKSKTRDQGRNFIRANEGLPPPSTPKRGGKVSPGGGSGMGKERSRGVVNLMKSPKRGVKPKKRDVQRERGKIPRGGGNAWVVT